MKACIVLQNQYAKLGHAIALTLKEKYGVEKFCAYVISTGAEDFIKSQDDIKYDDILVDHKIHANYKNETIDLSYIKNFEKEHAPPHLWNYFYSDRKMMMSIGPKEETTPEIDPLYSHEDNLRIFQARAKATEKMLKEQRPDFIFFFAFGTIGHQILYHTAKKMGIRVFNLDFPRIGNLISISEDYDTLTGVEEYANYYLQNKIQNTEEHNRAKRFIKQFRETGSLDLEYIELDVSANSKQETLLKPKNIFRSINYLITLYKNYAKNKGIFLYGIIYINPLRFILFKLRYRYRKWRGLSHLFDKPAEEDYAFYPLHFDPELATLLLSPFYFDQIALIRQIARALPLHFKLYVKEHPAMVYRRSLSFYKELKKIPNVKFIDHTIKSSELIKKSRLITTITGTVGWEASLLRKPVITFGNVFYNSLSFVKRIHDIEKLPELVNEQIEHYDYKENEMENFVAAVFKDAVPFNFSGIWYEGDLQKIRQDKGLHLLCDKLMEKMHGKHQE